MISKRETIRWISYTAALALCLFGAVTASCAGAKRYEARINADTARALGTAMDAVQELDLSLRKAACAVTPAMENNLCLEICSNAKQAEGALAILPVHSDSLEEIAKHISVVGDYAAMLSRANAAGSGFDERNLTQLAAFSETTSLLHAALAELQEKLASGEITNEAFNRITDALDNLENEAAEDVNTLASEMQGIAERFPEAEPLVYDGLYSAQNTGSPKYLEGRDPVTQAKAIDIAAEWIGVDADELIVQQENAGRVPFFLITNRDAENPATIGVTKFGGAVLFYTAESPQGDAKLAPDEAESIAAAYLADRGFDSMECLESAVSGGEAVFQFVPVLEGNVLCCPDQIAVTVSLLDGSVTGYHAGAYLDWHSERDLSIFNSSTISAQSAVPGFLTVQTTRPVILKGYGAEERFCCAVDCVSDDGGQYRILVNLKTGEQEQILLSEEMTDREMDES